jgi:hypothetical protein
VTRLREHPLTLLLPLQALIYFWNLGLLSPWFDEADQLRFMHGPLQGALATPASGGHPPLYFFLTYYWQRLPLGLAWTIQERTLSVLFALAATVVADRLWARRLPGQWRLVFLTLWTLSPFLLLYSRMGRSYSLQLLVGTAAMGLLLRYLEKPSRRTAAWLAGWLSVAVWVHYIPGAALIAAANVGLLARRRWREAAILDAIVGLLSIPLLFRLLAFLPDWGAHKSYALSGSPLTEIPLKIAYWGISWVMGEAVPDAVLIAGGTLMLGMAILLIAAVRRMPELAVIAAVAAIVGFAGVTRWVSYPFVPARMIFLYPVFLFLLVFGAVTLPRPGRPIAVAMIALSLCGIWCYFHRIDFRNKEYPMPLDEIAARIRQTPGSVVLVDSTNSDPIGMQLALGDPWRVVQTSDATAAAEVAAWLADTKVKTIWFLHNTHDVSDNHLNQLFEKRLQPAFTEKIIGYEPFTPLEKRVMHADYFSELVIFTRR